MGRVVLVYLSVTLFSASASLARTWYVMLDGTGDAITVQAGIDSAAVGDTVLVACGTYYEYDISMKSGICLRSETGQPDCVRIDAQQNSRVLYCPSLDNTTCIEGITIENGCAGGDPPDNLGGGAYCFRSSPRFINCDFKRNAAFGIGGAVYCLEDCSPVFVNCGFVGNDGGHGGALYISWRCYPAFTDCRFYRNSATWGGALDMSVTSVALTGCTLAGNVATWGGGILCRNCSVILTGCTFSGNSARWGAAIDCSDSGLEANNCILAFNVEDDPVICSRSDLTFSCCNVFGNAEGDYVGCLAGQEGLRGNFSADPRFCDPTSEDFHLDCSSPCAPPQQPECGLIGAWGVACGASRSEPTTWGAIKSIYR